MPVTNFIREPNFFQNVRNRNTKMQAFDFDSQFNAVASYINNQAVKTLNQILSQRVIGSTSFSDINKLFRNVGDGTFALSFLDNEAFENNSIGFNKLTKANPSSVIGASNDLSFKEIISTESNQILAARPGDTPAWRKILNNDVEDRQITANKIKPGSINNNNFTPGLLLQTQLIEESVTEPKIAGDTIPAAKLQDSSVDETVFNDAILFSSQGNLYLWGNVLGDNVFTGSITFVGKFSDGEYLNGTNIPLMRFKFNRNAKIPKSKFAADAFYTLNYLDLDKHIVTSRIKDDSINGERLFSAGGTRYFVYPYDINFVTRDGSIGIESFPANYKTALGL